MTEDRLQPQIDETMRALLPPGELADAIDRMITQLRTDPTVGGVQLGAHAPGFTLPEVRGGKVSLEERLRDGPVVVSFYRGGWCPGCNLELRALQQALPRIQALGASIVAISPERIDGSAAVAGRLGLEFDVCTDLDGNVARAYRLSFALPDDVRRIYDSLGLRLADVNADGTWTLPVPATFVIDRDGIVRARHVDADYRRRMEPEAIVDALRDLAG